MEISTARVQKVGSRKGWLPLRSTSRSKLLGLVRFPACKNSRALSNDEAWALLSFLSVYNTSLQGHQ